VLVAEAGLTVALMLSCRPRKIKLTPRSCR
jgi:hypothetical protein